MHWTLVTGGAVRLGAEICRAAGRAGRNIVIHYRHSQEQALHLQKELQGYGVYAEAIQGDFSTPQSTASFLESYCKRFPDTDAVVNNVGNYSVGPPSSADLADLMQVNAYAPLAIIQALLPSLLENQGRIINIGMAGAASEAAQLHAFAYNVSKQTLAAITKSLARELAVYGVAVNMVSPGYLEHSIEMPSVLSKIPAGRVGRFEEVARAVSFFLQRENGYITGQNLEVAGGVKL